MQPIKIAAVSCNSRLGDAPTVLDAMDRWCAAAAAEQADLVLFPELQVHGHCTPNTWEVAEAVPEGPSTRRLLAMAVEHGLFICAGLSEKEQSVCFNTQVLVGPAGYVGKQRKIHCSVDEGLFYKGGTELPVFDIGLCKLGISICFDGYFPEISRLHALHGADVILMPHAGRMRHLFFPRLPVEDLSREEVEHPPAEIQRQARERAFANYSRVYGTRALENACFTVVVDQAGVSGYREELPNDHPDQPHHPGAAFFCDPAGEVISHGT
jgi:predicted amidohydrolase